jgi:hypothetical protein
MTFEDRVAGVEGLGFTERQARFLVTVTCHAGVCMVRQYCAFCGIRHGQIAREFFARLTAQRLATAFECAHKRARIYHLRHRALYDSIGEPHSRLRKPVALARAVERLMVLDAVLANPSLRWLATEREKLEHFSLTLGSTLRRDECPRLVFGTGEAVTVRYFPDRLPVGVEAGTGTHVLLYLVTKPAPVDFRAFLQRHAELLRALPSWRVRLLVPRHLAKAQPAFRAAFQQELAAPLRPAVVDDLRWFFEERQRLPVLGDARESRDPDRFERLSRAFVAPRYRRLYRAWRGDGPRVLDSLTSGVLTDALARGSGGLEAEVLTRQYLHLSSLVGTA